MTREEILNLYFLDARAKLIDLAALLDRIERAAASPEKNHAQDFRLTAFQNALAELCQNDAASSERARRVLLAFSDPSTEPLSGASGKSACGAFNPAAQNFGA